jgi:hypothetical protein
MKKTVLLLVCFLSLNTIFGQTKPTSTPVVSGPTDTIMVSIANKKSVNGYLEFDVMVQGSHLRGKTGNYLSSLEIELDYNPTMFAHNLASGTPTGGKIEATNGHDFDQKTKSNKQWLPSYTVGIRNVTNSRIRLSLLMNYYHGAKHFRGFIDSSPRAAIHIKLPLENCMANSSGLAFVENGNITVGTYVNSIDATFGSSVRYLRHIFKDPKGINDVNCAGEEH